MHQGAGRWQGRLRMMGSWVLSVGKGLSVALMGVLLRDPLAVPLFERFEFDAGRVAGKVGLATLACAAELFADEVGSSGTKVAYRARRRLLRLWGLLRRRRWRLCGWWRLRAATGLFLALTRGFHLAFLTFHLGTALWVGDCAGAGIAL